MDEKFFVRSFGHSWGGMTQEDHDIMDDGFAAVGAALAAVGITFEIDAAGDLYVFTPEDLIVAQDLTQDMDIFGSLV